MVSGGVGAHTTPARTAPRMHVVPVDDAEVKRLGAREQQGRNEREPRGRHLARHLSVIPCDTVTGTASTLTGTAHKPSDNMHVSALRLRTDMGCVVAARCGRTQGLSCTPRVVALHRTVRWQLRRIETALPNVTNGAVDLDLVHRARSQSTCEASCASMQPQCHPVCEVTHMLIWRRLHLRRHCGIEPEYVQVPQQTVARRQKGLYDH